MSAITILGDRRNHLLKKRLRDLAALQSKVEAEIAQVRRELIRHGDLYRPREQRPACATEAGYQWHRQQGKTGKGEWPLPADDPCGCRAAHRMHARETWRKKRDLEIGLGEGEAS